MAGLSPDIFEQEILAICASSNIVKSVAQIQSGVYWVGLRVYLADDLFIDVFYNEETGKKSYALIRTGRRVFGADNTKKKWHWHPFEDPEKHNVVDHEILFPNFLQRAETHLSQQ